MTITSETRISQASPPPLFSEVDDEVVMLDVISGCYYNLDPVGSDIWKRLQNVMSVGELCAALQRDYNADAETIQHDVIPWLDQMLERDLIIIIN
ncbi:PqqD family protein [Niveispirillum sp. SYP-B3756]|uniref:PqqD family protein n=1 Tax=Niveispirillum sp. SYP-B3756 TaxID=2662178 RepID=UPI00156442A5|nr:PqqD family protein [Niveispirillum sp. SYP-B3756]